MKKIKKKFIIPILLVIVGIGTLLYVVFPILFFQIKFGPNYTNGNFISPIPNVLATSIVNLSGVDYGKASNWFPQAENKQAAAKISSYTLSIKKLGIEEAAVSIVSDDLFKNLVHYGGSALPGETGNAVVFGHSTLPQLFNPKNYKTIFSTLHNLKKGDEITTTADGVTFTYGISEIKVIDPSDISVLAQDSDGSYLTLITCTPPGTYWKRLVLKAKLKSLAT